MRYLSWLRAPLRVYERQFVPPQFDVNLDHIGREVLGPYYVSLRSKLAEDKIFDPAGGVMAEHPHDGSSYFNAMAHAHYALAHYEAYLEKRESAYLQRFLDLVDALIKHGVEWSNDALVYPFSLRFFSGQRVPWLHAMAQGQAIMACCRAYEETSRREYLRAARRAMIPFLYSIEEGGVCNNDDRRGVFYEEYAYHEAGKRHHTLNGMMSALMGLYDLHKTTGDETPHALFDAGIQTIRNSINGYDFPFCSSYDLRHENGEYPIFQARYNSVHVAHLRVLAKMAADDSLLAVANRWETNLSSRFNRLCLVAWYVNYKIQDVRADAQLLGGWKNAVISNSRRAFSRIRATLDEPKA